MSLLHASATVTWQAEVAKVLDGSRVQPQRAWLSDHLNAYVEHLVSDLAMIPTHPCPGLELTGGHNLLI
jgi:hypothetical protein